MDLKYYIWLQKVFLRKSQTAIKILDEFSSPEEFYRTPDKKREYLTQRDMDAISNTSVAECEEILRKCTNKGIEIITYVDERYPENLKNLFDPPVVIYAFGDTSVLRMNPIVSVAGTRKASERGKRTAAHYCYDLASAGAVVCTGVADGIDSAASEGALLAGGKTIGIMACSLDINYPAVTRETKKKIIEKGGVLISEYPIGMRALGENFRPRNRIFSGIADAFLAIEAPEISGTLITATHAIEQGKEIFSVPSDPYDELSKGTNNLIADGIPPALSGADVLLSLVSKFPDRIDFSKIDKNSKSIFFGGGVKEKAKKRTALKGNSELILAALEEGPLDFDGLVKKTGIYPSVLTGELISLEMDGYTEKDKAGKIVIK